MRGGEVQRGHSFRWRAGSLFFPVSGLELAEWSSHIWSGLCMCMCMCICVTERAPVHACARELYACRCFYGQVRLCRLNKGLKSTGEPCVIGLRETAQLTTPRVDLAGAPECCQPRKRTLPRLPRGAWHVTSKRASKRIDGQRRNKHSDRRSI